MVLHPYAKSFSFKKSLTLSDLLFVSYGKLLKSFSSPEFNSIDTYLFAQSLK